MKVCKVCGFHNVDASNRCLRCQAILDDGCGEPVRTSPRLKEHIAAQLCLVQGTIERVWRWLPLQRMWHIPQQPIPYRHPTVAAALSLFPPLAQLYNRQHAKALFVAGLFWGWGVCCYATLYHPMNNLLLLLWLLGWAAQCSDSIAASIRINREAWSFRNSLAMWFAVLFYAGLVVTALQFLLPVLCLVACVVGAGVTAALNHFSRTRASMRIWLILGSMAMLVVIGVSSLRGSGRIFAFVRLVDDVGGDEMRRGDLLLVCYGAYWFSEPEPGEIVHFDPPRFIAEIPSALASTRLVVNATDYFQRVTARGNDVVESTATRFLVNGIDLPRELWPFGWEEMPPLTRVVPSDHYFLPVVLIPRDVLAAALGGLVRPGSANNELIPTPRRVFQPGWIFSGWEEASMVPREAIRGKVLCVVNPPPRRHWVSKRAEARQIFGTDARKRSDH
jgi:hypothetical protein